MEIAWILPIMVIVGYIFLKLLLPKLKSSSSPEKEDEKVWRGAPKYEELRREINLVSEEFFTELTGFDETFYERIVKNRPYFDIEELKDVEGIGPKRFQKLKENFWFCDLSFMSSDPYIIIVLRLS